MESELPNIEDLKKRACRAVDEWADRLWETSLAIHSHPELGYQEVHAASLLCDLLSAGGMEVERTLAGLETAFRGRLPGAPARPAIAVLAEYDALPRIGHGCGHNLIGVAAAGAGIAAAALGDELPGSVVVLGCPAEESSVDDSGGKIKLLATGVFDEIDAAIMMHPGTIDLVPVTGSLASAGLEFEFFGKAAHAAIEPEQGINALDAVIQTFVGVNALRQHVRSDVRIHGIITDGGQSPNIVPAHACCRFRIRSENREYLAEVIKRVRACAEAAATATGARLAARATAAMYEEMRPNKVVAELMSGNLVHLGRVLYTAPLTSKASSDLGNVSQRIPAACATIKIAEGSVAFHSAQFAAVAASDGGRRALLDGAKTLVLTAIDLICDGDRLAAAQQECEARSARASR